MIKLMRHSNANNEKFQIYNDLFSDKEFEKTDGN